jgi:hypothetical protein
MMKIWLCIVCLSATPVLAQDLGLGPELAPNASVDVDRDPASLPQTAKKRAYPGAADEEDLRVQTELPEAVAKSDARSIQREIYKQLYNQELKEEQQNDMEE